MLLLGIDIGTSSIKVSLVDAASRQCLASVSYPDKEAPIISLQAGWAEQSPAMWWDHLVHAMERLHATALFDAAAIKAIGIAYQMHGLVLVDEAGNVLRNSIIWCDSRAVPYGDVAFDHIGSERCLSCLLNSPGNFTAGKLAWVKENEPAVFQRIHKVLLPGDFISKKLTGEYTTSISALSEAVVWNFRDDAISGDVLNYFDFDPGLFPAIREVFSEHGKLQSGAATELGLSPGITVTYKAGDQPNNALSLNVLEPGEVAATAGTSGVIYAVTDQLTYDPQSRVNSFAHVNYKPGDKHIGVLLCINGAGITNQWIRSLVAPSSSYEEMNAAIKKIIPGSEGLLVLPFGNGSERMLQNRLVGAHVFNVDFNKHTAAHFYRAGQEGIAFAFRYGLDIMRENGIQPSVIRAGKNNMFLSETFAETFVNATGVTLELYKNDGSVGAAIGAGIGAGIYSSAAEAFDNYKPLRKIFPEKPGLYNELYFKWKNALDEKLNTGDEETKGNSLTEILGAFDSMQKGN